MKFLKIFSLSLVLCILAPITFAQDPDSSSSSPDSEMKAMLNDIAVNGKVAGMCGMIRQLTFFQESTQMVGGNEFIERFLSTEAARLGQSLTEFLEGCIRAVDKFDKMQRQLL